MKNFRVLVADDMSTVRRIITSALVKHFPAIKIDEVSNGKEALAKLENKSYDFIISDWEMPDVTGINLLEWVRNHPKLKATPFLMITAKNEIGNIQHAIQKGVNGYLVKPFTMDALVQKITALVDSFDRRVSERFVLGGNVTLNFDSHVCKGNLLDISEGGLLGGGFQKKDPFPNILEKVQIDLETENKHNVTGVEGFIVRLQAEEPRIDARHVKIAVKFKDELAGRKKEEVHHILSILKTRHSGPTLDSGPT